MATPTYRVTCPIDGMTLLPVVLDPQSAPWFCVGCRHSWFAAELSEAARARFRPGVQDFGFGEPMVALQEAVAAEIADARDRKTSCREDMLELLPEIGLEWIMNVDSDFKELVKAELARKKG